MKSKFLIALIVGLFLAGCNYELPKTTEPVDNSNKPEANKPANANQSNNANQVNSNADVNKSAEKSDKEESGGKLVFTKGSATPAQACNGREVEVDESATALVINLTGECRKLTVDGVSNKVYVDKVAEIIVKGISNKVIYGEGSDGKKPKISKSGTSTEVNSKEEIEKKKEAANN